MTTAPAASTGGRRGAWRGPALLALVVALAATLLTAAPRAAQADWVGAEQRFVNLLNRERVAHGLATVEVNLQMVRIARDWSEQMAAVDVLSHRPDIPGAVSGPWERLGENVGRIPYRSGDALGEAVDRLHQAFMDSPGHRANVLGDFNQVGVGVTVSSQGRLWVTFNFLKGPVGRFPLFEDIAGSSHRETIERVWVGNFARGCRSDRYCPGNLVTRDQMATFIARAAGLQPVVSNRFADVDPGSVHAGAINALVDAGIAQGCASGRYCPDQPVTRAQMATFLARALQLAPRTAVEFLDVLPTSPHFGNINAVAEAAITAGCDGTGLRYCPGDPVRRDQMASFLSRAFEAPVSFWQADQPSGQAPPGSTDGEPETGDEPVVHERQPPP